MELDFSCLPEVAVHASGFEGEDTGVLKLNVMAIYLVILLCSGMRPCTLVNGYLSSSLKIEAVYVKYWFHLLHYTVPQPGRPQYESSPL
jgi:hypothetical protein